MCGKTASRTGVWWAPVNDSAARWVQAPPRAVSPPYCARDQSGVHRPVGSGPGSAPRYEFHHEVPRYTPFSLRSLEVPFKHSGGWWKVAHFVGSGWLSIRIAYTAGTIRHAWSSPTKAMGIHMNGQERVPDRPSIIRNTQSGGRAVIRRSLPLSLLGFLFPHASQSSTLFG